MDETELIARIRDGDVAAGAQLVSVLGPELYRHAARLAGDQLSQTDSEIVAETALEKAVASISSYDPARGEFRGWVFGILRRVVLDAVAARRGVVSLDRIKDVLVDGPDTRPARSSPTPRVAPDLTAAVLTLPVTDQTLLVLRHDTRLTWDEIADIVGGVNAAACRKRHSRIIARLRRILETPPPASLPGTTTTNPPPQES